MMRVKKRYCCLTALAFVAFGAASLGQEANGTVVLDGIEYDVVRIDSVGSPLMQALPAGTSLGDALLRRVGGGSSVVAGAATNVYRSIDGPIFAANGVNRLLADDLRVASADGCDFQTITVGVFRPTAAPAPLGFTITQLSVWDRCPGQAGATMLINLLSGSGTAAIDCLEGFSATVPMLNGQPIPIPVNDACVVAIDRTNFETPIPEEIWLAIAFSKADSGWIGGAAPTIGFSENVIHVDNPAAPQLRCNAVFQPQPGQPDLYSAMFADIVCLNADPYFTGYQANTETAVFYGGAGCSAGGLGGCGDGIDVQGNCEAAAESIKPIVADCRLHSYSVNLAGLSGPFDIEFELWTDDRSDPLAPKPGTPIPGTRGCYHAAGNGFLESANFTFDGTVTLPERFWLVWADDDADGGPVASAGTAAIGESTDPAVDGEFFAVLQSGNWDQFVLPQCGDGSCGNFEIMLTCLGDEPLGACCARNSGTCNSELFVRECPRSIGRWQALVDCDQATFDPPCGVSSCCKVNPSDPTMTICEDEFPSDCTAEQGESTAGVFCSEVESCGVPACIGASGDCLSEHLGPGCSDNDCCNTVCRTDPFCCAMDWDDNCSGLAAEVCGDVPPVNNACVDAVSVDLGTTRFNTTLATTDGPRLPDGAPPAGELDCASGGTDNAYVLGKDVWFRYTATERGILSIELCSNATTYDSRIAVYEDCTCPPGDVVGCDDDGCAIEFRSKLDVAVEASTCYLIRVGGWGENSSGAGEMNLSFVPGPTCPTVGTVTFVDPPDGTVDARYPHPLDSLLPRQGIQTIIVHAPAGIDDSCIELCETDDEGSANTKTIVENPPGTYTIALGRTITVGAVTTIHFAGINAVGRFVSHPGNVTGANGAGPADVTAMVACLQGQDLGTNCPGNPFSRDLDFSGALNPLDLMAVVNALNGAGTLDSTNGTPNPSGAGCP